MDVRFPRRNLSTLLLLLLLTVVRRWKCKKRFSSCSTLSLLLTYPSFVVRFTSLRCSLRCCNSSSPTPAPSARRTHAGTHTIEKQSERQHTATHTHTNSQRKHTQAQALLNLMIYCCCWNQLHASWYWNQQLCLVVVVVDWITWYQQLCVRIPFK